MIRVFVYLASVLAAAIGLSWLADNPGTVSIHWPALNLRAEPSVFQTFVALAALLAVSWAAATLVRHVWNSPRNVGHFLNKRNQQRGLDALSNGMIAIGSGDPAGAKRFSALARKALPNEPLTHLLRAQTAQISGDKATARRIFEAMLASPDTEALGLRGLFTEAEREGEPEAARQFAERALKLNPKLAWASTALFDMQCKAADFEGALETLSSARRNELIDRATADRRRSVLLTGLAVASEDSDPNRALTLATEAHGLAPDLVPAAALAGRMLASRGNTAKAAKILQKAWTQSPHPDLATAYAYARIGDSPRDRLERVKQLAAINPHSIESAVAVANAAIDSKHYDDARDALKPQLEGNLTQRVATLMARIESEQFADKGRVREWLARAVNAPRDPVWTADGVVSEEWAPVSPVTGQLDAFQWRVPVEAFGARDSGLVTRKIEELVALGAPREIDGGETGAAVIAPVAAPANKEKARTPAAAKPAAVDIDELEVVPPAAAPISVAQKPTAPARPTIVEPPVTVVAKPAAKPEAAAASPVKTVGNPASHMGKSTAAGEAVIGASEPIKGPPSAAADKPAARAAAPQSRTVTADPAPGARDAKEPRVFVVPHAPDDPGPDSGEAEAPAKGMRPPYRAVP